jgi:endoribonuclease Dicer
MVTLNAAELDVLKEAHFALFTGVLKIHAQWLDCSFDRAEKNYLVVPLCFMPFMDPLEAFVDFELARKLAILRPNEGPTEISDLMIPISWPDPDPVTKFRDAIVVRKYDTQCSLHEVIEVSPDLKASSAPDFDTRHSTFKAYFQDKYNCTFTDDAQPALLCRSLGESSARLQLLTSRYKTQAGADHHKGTKNRRQIILFPEVCNFYPLPTRFWKLSFCVPSILWRVECFLAVDTLRVAVASDTGIGRLSDGSELTTSVSLSGYKDVAFGRLDSQRLTAGDLEMVNETSHDPLEPPLRGPNDSLLLQALIPRGATDSVDLERLETLGDAFLKFSTTVFLYHDRVVAHEGKLSMARSRRVCNQNLYRLAKKRGITKLIFSSKFEPRGMWIPPCFDFDDKAPGLTPLYAIPCTSSTPNCAGTPPQASVDLSSTSPSTLQDPGVQNAPAPSMGPKSEQEKQYLYHRVAGKGVADSVESLIGAYLVAGGIAAGLKFMNWMGIKIQSDHGMETEAAASSSSDLEEGEILSSGSLDAISLTPSAKKMRLTDKEWLPVFIQDSELILQEFFCSSPSLMQLTDGQVVELNRLLSISFGTMDIQTVLGCNWQFRDRMLLLQAVTHASYTKNRLTECYQRLEFLGDAVLDYLVTCHIYSTFGDYGPGEITSMRSALVNNSTFAELAVGLNLHKCLLYNSPSLYSQVERFLKASNGCEQSMEESEVREDSLLITAS